MRRWFHTVRRWLGGIAPADAACHPWLSAVVQAEACYIGPHWRMAWASRAGPHHANQDCAGARLLQTADGPWLAAALADGVTQAAAGEVAARSLVGHWLGSAPPVEPAGRTAWLAAAEPAVASALAAVTPQPGGATGAALWLRPDGQGWCTRVGDCRVLLAAPARCAGWQGADAGCHADRAGWLVQPLMPDQTLATVHPLLYPDPLHSDAQQPAHFVGCDRLGTPEWQAMVVHPDELLLLASDGLHAVLAPADWQHVLAQHLGPAGRASPGALDMPRWRALLDDLLQTAQRLGSEDDITVLMVAREAQAGGVP